MPIANERKVAFEMYDGQRIRMTRVYLVRRGRKQIDAATSRSKRGGGSYPEGYFRGDAIELDTVSMAKGPGVVRKGGLGIFSIRQVHGGGDVLEAIRKKLSGPDPAVFDDHDYRRILTRLFDLKKKAATLPELAGARVPMVETLDALLEEHGEKNKMLVARRVVQKYPDDPSLMEMVLRNHAITEFGLYRDRIKRNRNYRGPLILN